MDWRVTATAEQTILSLAMPTLSLGVPLPTTTATFDHCSGSTEIA